MPEVTMDCPECGRPQTADGRCVNPDCERAQVAHSHGASRLTAKAGGAAVSEPRAWRSSGGVD
jgi:hypothetical protein